VPADHAGGADPTPTEGGGSVSAGADSSSGGSSGGGSSGGGSSGVGTSGDSSTGGGLLGPDGFKVPGAGNQGGAGGSGVTTQSAAVFAVSEHLLVTCAAVVRGAGSISVQWSNGTTSKARVVRSDDAAGLALVRVDDRVLKPVHLASQFDGGEIQCAAMATADVFTPTAELIDGDSPAPPAERPNVAAGKPGPPGGATSAGATSGGAANSPDAGASGAGAGGGAFPGGIAAGGALPIELPGQGASGQDTAATGWTVHLKSSPRLMGAPLLTNGFVVGVEMADSGTDLTHLPAVSLGKLTAFLGKDVPPAATYADDPCQAVALLVTTH
jgi:hypothetical protein